MKIQAGPGIINSGSANVDSPINYTKNKLSDLEKCFSGIEGIILLKSWRTSDLE